MSGWAGVSSQARQPALHVEVVRRRGVRYGSRFAAPGWEFVVAWRMLLSAVRPDQGLKWQRG
ncbi:MAG: hypothetical protein M1473_11175 [Firmicutes bacterium]|nr:hypothetical protein [Bacillota bacterium]